MDVLDNSGGGYQGTNGVLWNGDLARSWHRFRVVASAVSLLAGLILAVLWGWYGGLATAGLALLPLVDGVIARRNGRTSAGHSIAIDTTAIGMAMLIVCLRPEAVGAPFLYMVLVATLFLPTKQGVFGVLYATIWTGVALAPIELVAMPDSASQSLITGIAFGIFSVHIVVLLAVMIRAVERNAIERSDALERLERASASKDRFLASISHEIRTPLTSVVGFASLLSEQSLSPHVADMVSVVTREAHEVAHIVEDLLVAARADLGTINLVAERTDVSAAAIAAVAGLGIDAKVHSLESGDVAAVADPSRVRQILRALLTNAERYGGPDIGVTVAATDDTVRVAVSDDGPGVPPSQVDRIFAPYHRAHHVAGQPEAIGLGLYIARHLAHLMGGDLLHRREYGRTVFVLSLPRHDEIEESSIYEPIGERAIYFARDQATAAIP